MAEFWQYIAIVVFLIVAVIYLIFHFQKSHKNKKGCKNCALYAHIDKMNKTRNNHSPSTNQKLL